MMLRHLVLAVIGVAVGVGSARAQLCAGAPSFVDGRVQMSFSMDPNDVRTVAAGVAVGGRHEFGQVTLVKIYVPEFGDDGTGAVATGGSQVPLDRGGLLHFCPLASVSLVRFKRGTLPDILHSSYVFGGGVGAVTFHPPHVQVIPAVSLSFVFDNVRVSGIGGGDATSTTEYLGVLTLGGGVLVDRVFSFWAFAVIPVGLEGAENSYEVGASVNFGRRLNR